MVQIQEIEISYFRSIYRMKVGSIEDILVIVGQNDVGKSNFLRALNLFFNNETDPGTHLSFYDDYNSQRLSEVRSEAVKGRQFIQVALMFSRGKDRFEKTMPERFRVTKTWYRDDLNPQTTVWTGQKDKQKSLEQYYQRYLASTKFEYVPAVKDDLYFRKLLGKFQEVVLSEHQKNSNLQGSIEVLNAAVETASDELGQEFHKVSGVSAKIALPANLSELFSSFIVNTESSNTSKKLSFRGNGIQARFIPSILYYLAKMTRHNYIWGIEEPENCLEFRLASRLMNDICATYSKDVQVLMTTHSPAFYTTEAKKVSVFRLFRADDGKVNLFCCKDRHGWKETSENEIAEDIGLMELQKKNEAQLQEAIHRAKALENLLVETHNQIRDARKPILLTEGKWDAIILKDAWAKVRKVDCPYKVMSCNLGSNEESITFAGADMLKQCIETVRKDSPKTVAIFDNDFEGRKKCYDRLTNFKLAENDTNIRFSMNGRAAAIVLPVVPGREKYDSLTLSMEFMLPDSALERKVNGRGLEFVPIKTETKLAGPSGEIIATAMSDQPHHRNIVKESKKHFYESVLPTLTETDYYHFGRLFELIDQAFEGLVEA